MSRFDVIREIHIDHIENIEKANPYHDERGRFTTANRGISTMAINNGGSSTNLITGKSPTTGYMVCINPERGLAIDVPAGSKSEKIKAVQAHVKDFIEKNKDLLFDKGANKCMGTWVDTENNKLWLDVSTHFTNKSKAIKAANDNGEIAIFDVKNCSEIRLRDNHL